MKDFLSRHLLIYFLAITIGGFFARANGQIKENRASDNNTSTPRTHPRRTQIDTLRVTEDFDSCRVICGNSMTSMATRRTEIGVCISFGIESRALILQFDGEGRLLDHQGNIDGTTLDSLTDGELISFVIKTKASAFRCADVILPMNTPRGVGESLTSYLTRLFKKADCKFER